LIDFFEMMYNISNLNMNFFKKNLTKNLFRIILMAFLITAPALSFAETTSPEPIQGTTPSDLCKDKICNPISTNTIQEFIKVLLEGVLKIGIPIVALAVIYCGFLFVSAMGNSEKLTKAKNALLYTLIGAAILLGSWAIAELISATVTELGP